jgi:hypothetical protein
MRIYSEFESVDGIFMSSQGLDQFQTASIPQLHRTVVSGSCKDVLIRMKGQG